MSERMRRLRGVIAMDGPSGTGKSTVSRRLAAEFDAAYLDTGAMYRAATLAVLRAEVDPTDEITVAGIVRAAVIESGTDPHGPWITLDGEDVSVEIRGTEVTGAVSAVSSVGEVRELMVNQQRALIAETAGGWGSGIVVEGRDIGTVVAVGADLKVYLTASESVRASRRSAQDLAAGRESTTAKAADDVRRRDTVDSARSVSPLRKAHDAVEVDTSRLDVDGVLTRLRELALERGVLVDAERDVDSAAEFGR